MTTSLQPMRALKQKPNWMQCDDTDWNLQAHLLCWQIHDVTLVESEPSVHEKAKFALLACTKWISTFEYVNVYIQCLYAHPNTAKSHLFLHFRMYKGVRAGESGTREGPKVSLSGTFFQSIINDKTDNRTQRDPLRTELFLAWSELSQISKILIPNWALPGLKCTCLMMKFAIFGLWWALKTME